MSVPFVMQVIVSTKRCGKQLKNSWIRISQKNFHSLSTGIYTHIHDFLWIVWKRLFYAEALFLSLPRRGLRFTDKQLPCLSCTFWSNVTQKRGEFRFPPKCRSEYISREKCPPTLCIAQSLPLLLFLRDIFSVPLPQPPLAPAESCSAYLYGSFLR